MSNFENVRKFMKTFGQEVKEKAKFPSSKITSLRYDLIREELLEFKEAIEKKEIKSIDVKAFSILLGGIGREFFKEKNKKSINLTPEESANSITSIILNGIKLEN